MLKRAVHPGEILKEEPAKSGASPTEFVYRSSVPPDRVSQIINSERCITGDTFLCFDLEPAFWLHLLIHFELARAEEESGERIRLLPTREDQLPWPVMPRAISMRMMVRATPLPASVGLHTVSLVT